VLPSTAARELRIKNDDHVSGELDLPRDVHAEADPVNDETWA
jgi:hypothetical protein